MFRRCACLLALAAVVPTLAGCGFSPRHGDSRPTVVVSFYPLQFVAQRVVGDHARVITLAQPGVEPHDLQLTVRQTALTSAADVGVYERGFQPAVDQVMTNDSPAHLLDVADVVPLRAPVAGEGAEGATGRDPHFWQDPTLLARVVTAFTDLMVRVDPAHAKAYRAHGRALRRDLTALDRAFRRGLHTCATRTILVSHDAFEYLARRYHLHVVSIAGLTPESEPSPKHIARLADVVAREHLSTVFSEPLESPKLAEALSGDLHLRRAVLDPIEGLTSADESQDYLSLMRNNLAAIRRANSCS